MSTDTSTSAGTGIDGFPDDRLSERFRVYTRGNIGEILPDPLSPMHISLIGNLDRAQRRAFERMGVYEPHELDADTRLTYPVVNGYAFLNLSVFRVVGVRVDGLTPELIDEALATSPDLPPYEPHPDDENPEAGARMAETLNWAISVDALPEVDDAERQIDDLRRNRPDLSAMSVPELIARYRDLNDVGEDHWARHLYISFCRAFPYGLIAMFAPNEEGRATPIELLEIAGGADLESAAPAMKLWELSRTVATSPALTELFDGGVFGLRDRLRAGDDPEIRSFGDAFDDFVRDYGYRGVGEVSLSSSTWETHPESALTLIDRLRAAPDDQAPAAQRAKTAEQGDANIDKLVAHFDEATGALLRAAAVAARTLDEGRERCKANAVKANHEQRITLREIGRRFVASGDLERIDDIFMVRDEEIEDFISDPAPYRERIVARRQHHERLHDLDPPFAFTGSPPPYDSWTVRAAEGAATAGEVLTGLTGSIGIATGRARVIRDLDDCDDFESGDILVAPMTDAAWTPLFVPAAAVVTEIGGSASHAVIVAREFGIPCVTSVAGATDRIPDGATITVDGRAGTVTIG